MINTHAQVHTHTYKRDYLWIDSTLSSILNVNSINLSSLWPMNRAIHTSISFYAKVLEKPPKPFFMMHKTFCCSTRYIDILILYQAYRLCFFSVCSDESIDGFHRIFVCRLSLEQFIFYLSIKTFSIMSEKNGKNV
jgi:hypothetical protein